MATGAQGLLGGLWGSQWDHRGAVDRPHKPWLAAQSYHKTSRPQAEPLPCGTARVPTPPRPSLPQGCAAPSRCLLSQALLWRASRRCTQGALPGASRTASSAATRRTLSSSSPAQVRHQGYLGGSGWEPSCALAVPRSCHEAQSPPQAQEHGPHLRTDRLNSVSVWTWTLTCHCPEVVREFSSTILVPPNWTFPQSLLGPVPALAEARTVTEM